MPTAKPWTGIPKPGDDTIITSGTEAAFYATIPAGILTLDRGGLAPVVLDMHGGGFASGLSVNTVGEGGDVALNIIGTTLDYQTFVNNGTINDSFGVLDLGVTGLTTMTNNGSITVQGGIGNSTLNINLTSDASNTNAAAPGPTAFINSGVIAARGGGLNSTVALHLNSTTTRFDNRGTLEADATSQQTSLIVSGIGHFDNDGTILVEHDGVFKLAQNGSFANTGKIDVIDAAGSAPSMANGTITFGVVGAAANFTNSGTLEADGDSALAITAARSFETLWGTLLNSGVVEAAGGQVSIYATVTQSATGRISIDNGGSVWLGGASSGGLVQINNGTLAFGGSSQVTYGPTAARGFTSNLSFTGSAGSLDFSAGALSVSESFSSASAGTGELLVYDSLYRQLADIHLLGNYNSYDFTTVGAKVNFTAHPPIAPTVTGPVTNQPVASGATIHPFAAVRITDTDFNYNAKTSATIILSDATSGGQPTDADGLLSGTGLSVCPRSFAFLTELSQHQADRGPTQESECGAV